VTTSPDIATRLGQRLESLKAEFARGQERLAQLDNEAAQLRQTLLRISGAIQVLEEELGKAADATAAGDPAP
jgi:predicted nuclease with TOPRIM domain